MSRRPPPGWPVRIDPTFGCWLFVGRLDRDGYGRIGRQLAHRALWESLHGPIAEGYELDHTCRRRACVRHLELATRAQQERLKSWRKRVQKSACSEGHPVDLYGIVTPEGGLVCRACR